MYNFTKLDEIFEANPNIEGAVIFNSTCYILGNYLKARAMQSVKLVGYDLIERNTQLLSEGVITALVAQRPNDRGMKESSLYVVICYSSNIRKSKPDADRYSPQGELEILSEQ